MAGGHAIHIRDAVRVNLEIARFLGAPAPGRRILRRAMARRKPRALFISSPIGLGHVQRDLAIARELRRLTGDLEIDWLAQHPVTRVLEDAGETMHPLSSALADLNSVGPVSAAPYGSPSILLIPWVYIALMGGPGLTRHGETWRPRSLVARAGLRDKARAPLRAGQLPRDLRGMGGRDVAGRHHGDDLLVPLLLRSSDRRITGARWRRPRGSSQGDGSSAPGARLQGQRPLTC